ncbi:MAG: phytanoyl-CoA dioxygenase family protein [Chitinophagaceae bacterium]
MKEFIRRFKIAYAVYNFFHRTALAHNIPLFKKYGIKKQYFSSLSSKDFPNNKSVETAPGHQPAIQESELFQSAAVTTRESMLGFTENGFLIIRNYLSAAQVDAVNKEMEQLTKDGTVKQVYGSKIMFAIHHSALLRKIGEDKKLLDLLGRLLNGDAVLFQSINFTMGSGQKTHSDSIHMTTHPLGGLLGVWIALDDVDENNGPLHYYPGSHQLPYYLNADYNNEGSAWLLGKKSYAEYEEMMAKKIVEKGLKKQVFTARKGDLLVWHANLFHGGEPHKDKRLTRKSMVLHYFKKDAICYHEITQRPALLKKPR